MRYARSAPSLGIAFPKVRRVKRRAKGTRWPSGTAKVSEAALQAQCEQYLDACGLRWFHVPAAVGRVCAMESRVSIGEKREVADYLKGVPDLLIFSEHDGGKFTRALLVELKVGDNTMSAGQRLWAAGTNVNEVRTFDAFCALVEEFRRL